MKKKKGNELVIKPILAQEKFLKTTARFPAFIAGWGTGKRINIEQEIKTTKGWKRLGHIVDGDVVYGRDGGETTVLEAHPIVTVPTGYELEFDSGEKVIADPQHLWYTITVAENKSGKRRKQSPSCFGSVKTTEEIIRTIRTSNNYENNHRVPITQPIIGSTKKFRIEPYTLGSWLGDGNSNTPHITTEDVEVLENIRRDGYETKKVKSTKNLYHIGNGEIPQKKPCRSLKAILREMKLLGNKHIPDEYMNGNIEQRMELLRGLMDTDGSADERGGICEFTSINKELADQVCELANSLGIKARIYGGKATLNGRYISEKYRVTFKTKQQIFKLSRKQERVDASTSNQMARQLNRWIVGYKTAENVKMRCLTVDSRDGLFLIGRAFIATHNTMFSLIRGMKLSEAFPNNLGLVVRREFTDLKDSSMRDYERYFGRTVGSDKDVVLANGSRIMFRHGSELDVLKNINLGWFLMEQAEEFETDEQFQYLRGRLRRENVVHSGMLVGNVNGHNWIWQHWKASPPSKEYVLFEATSLENEANLPASFVEDIKQMEHESPNQYARFVLNDWSEQEDADCVIPFELIEEAVGRKITQNVTKRVVFCDVAEGVGRDETVIYALENEEIIDSEFSRRNDPMETAGRILRMKKRTGATLAGVDAIGVGAGTYYSLKEIDDNIIANKSSENASLSGPGGYKNLKAEMWWNARTLFKQGYPSIPNDEVLKRQLSIMRFHTNRKGEIELEKKELTSKRLGGKSPDRADAYVGALWLLKKAQHLNDNVLPFRMQTKMANSYSIQTAM